MQDFRPQDFWPRLAAASAMWPTADGGRVVAEWDTAMRGAVLWPACLEAAGAGVRHPLGDLMSALGLLRSAAQVRTALRRRAVYVDLLQWDDEACPVEGNVQAWRAGIRTGGPGQAWRLPVTQRPVVGDALAVSGIPPRNGGRGRPADMQLGLEHPGAGS